MPERWVEILQLYFDSLVSKLFYLSSEPVDPVSPGSPAAKPSLLGNSCYKVQSFIWNGPAQTQNLLVNPRIRLSIYVWVRFVICCFTRSWCKSMWPHEWKTPSVLLKYQLSSSHTVPLTLSPSSLSLAELLWGGVAAGQPDQNGSYLGLGHHHMSVGGMCMCGWAWSRGMQTHYRPCGMRWNNWPRDVRTCTDQDQYMTVRSP